MTEQELNIYAPPEAERKRAAVSGLTRVRLPRPPAVIAATVILGAYTLSTVVHGINNVSQRTLTQFVVAMLMLVGIVRGHALAWQWCRFLSPIAVIASAFVLSKALTKPPGSISWLLIASLLVFITGSIALPILLSQKASKKYFGLGCPQCGSLRNKAANFFYTAYRCRDCQSTWR